MQSYDEVRDQIGRGTSHLLLGNGFSIGCDPVFRYESLYDAAREGGLSERAQQVFGKLGTNNFEGVLRLLEEADWVAREYGYIDEPRSAILDDVAVVKRALVEAVARSHLAHTGLVKSEMKNCASTFLRPYQNVFTTNYDLVLYWVVMYPEKALFQDGFAADHEDPDVPYLVFDGAIGRAPGMLYLHGALHLYVVDGEVRKRSWTREDRPLTELVRDGLERGDCPLFVAEGAPEKKLEQIQRSGYLYYCLDKLSRIKAPLVVYGHSLGPTDSHISDVIADNTALTSLYVGLHGDPDGDQNLAIRANVGRIVDRRRRMIERGGGEDLMVDYFPSESARVWGDDAE